MKENQQTLNIFKPSHLNSIYYSSYTNRIYLIAHNSTAHTNRNSDIIVMDFPSGKIINIINTKAHSALLLSSKVNNRL
jgi:hypothetical protein